METSLEWKIVIGKEDLPVGTAGQEEKRKTTKIMEEPSDGLYEIQKHRRRYGRRQTSLAFGSGWTALGCIGPKIRNKEGENKKQ